MVGGVPLGVRQYLNIRGVDYRFVTETSGLLCSNAVIPGSTLADTKVIGNYQGVIENMTHARIFPDIALEFYVDKDYKMVDMIKPERIITLRWNILMITKCMVQR